MSTRITSICRLLLIAVGLTILLPLLILGQSDFNKSEFAARRAKVFEKIGDGIAIVFAACPEQADLARWRSACGELRARLPGTMLVTVRLPLDPGVSDEAALQDEVDLVFRSFAEAVAFVQARGGGPGPSRSAPFLPMNSV